MTTMNWTIPFILLKWWFNTQILEQNSKTTVMCYSMIDSNYIILTFNNNNWTIKLLKIQKILDSQTYNNFKLDLQIRGGCDRPKNRVDELNQNPLVGEWDGLTDVGFGKF